MSAQLKLAWDLAAVGMKRADDAECEAWKERADFHIAELAAGGDEFTAEDVRKLAGNPTRPNAFGARFNYWSKRGLIQKVGYRNATRATLHAHPIAVWRGA